MRISDWSSDVCSSDLMAEDGLFFDKIADVHSRTHVPVFDILLQGAAAITVALSGTYGQILSYVVSVDFIWLGLTVEALFVFRRRDRAETRGFKTTGHPFTTDLLVAACPLVFFATVFSHPTKHAKGSMH